LGNWKNYDELEDQLSVEELVATLQAHRKMRREEQKFLAAIQGIEIPDDNVAQSDITDLRGFRASQEGFGIGKGLSHSVVEVVEA
jgi:hypothetical protein